MISAGWHAHLNYDWWGLPSGEAALALYCWQALGNTRQSLDWTIVEVTLGPDSERPVYGSWALGVGVTRGQGLWHLPQPTEESKGKGLHWGQWEAGAWARDLGWPKRSPRGKAYVEGNGKLGLRCIDRGKMQDLGWPSESKGKGLHWGQWEAGTQCVDLRQTVLWEDTGQATSRWFDELKSWYYIYSTGLVLSTGLSQTVTKELVTNELTFNSCESQSQDQDSPVPELSATTITFNPCKP